MQHDNPDSVNWPTEQRGNDRAHESCKRFSVADNRAERLETRPLGTQGLAVTRLGLGLAALGRPAYINIGHAEDFPEGRTVQAMEAHSGRMLDRAFAAGIRYFDVARSYGLAEQFLRRWIDRRGIRSDQVVVGSKWGYRYTGDWHVDGRVQEVKDHGEAMLQAQLAESTSILGPYLKLYQIHSATPESGVLDDAKVLDRLRELRAGGLLIGVTASGNRQAETVHRALEIQCEGQPLFSSVQATWNLLERGAEPALREAHRAGVTVLIKEPLANGLLTANADLGRTGPLRAAADGLSVSADVPALAFVARQPWVDVVLLGAATEAQLDSNLRALEVRLSAEQVHLLDAMREPSERYWSRRAGLPWN